MNDAEKLNRLLREADRMQALATYNEREAQRASAAEFFTVAVSHELMAGAYSRCAAALRDTLKEVFGP